MTQSALLSVPLSVVVVVAYWLLVAAPSVMARPNSPYVFEEISIYPTFGPHFAVLRPSGDIT